MCLPSPLPAQWSDHAPLVLKLRGVSGLGPRPPCDLSSRKMTRFDKRGAVARMFAAATRKSSGEKRSRDPEGERSNVDASGGPGSPQASGVGTSAGTVATHRDVHAVAYKKSEGALTTAGIGSAAQAPATAEADPASEQPHPSPAPDNPNCMPVSGSASAKLCHERASGPAGRGQRQKESPKPQQRSIKAFFQPTAGGNQDPAL